VTKQLTMRVVSLITKTHVS